MTFDLRDSEHRIFFSLLACNYNACAQARRQRRASGRRPPTLYPASLAALCSVARPQRLRRPCQLAPDFSAPLRHETNPILSGPVTGDPLSSNASASASRASLPAGFASQKRQYTLLLKHRSQHSTQEDSALSTYNCRCMPRIVSYRRIPLRLQQDVPHLRYDSKRSEATVRRPQGANSMPSA